MDMKFLLIIMLVALCGCSTQSLNNTVLSYSEYYDIDCLSSESTICIHPDSGLSKSDVSAIISVINSHVGHVFPASGARKRHIESQYEVVLGSYSEIDAIEEIVIIEKKDGGWVVLDIVESFHCAG